MKPSALCAPAPLREKFFICGSFCQDLFSFACTSGGLGGEYCFGLNISSHSIWAVTLISTASVMTDPIATVSPVFPSMKKLYENSTR